MLARHLVNHDELLDSVAEHFDAQHLFLVGGMHLDRVAPYPKAAAYHLHVVAVVLEVDELTQDGPLVVIDAGVKFEQLTPVFFRRAHAVDAAH